MYPRRSERLHVEARICPLAPPLRSSPFDRRCRHAPSPLPLAAVIEHSSRTECSDRTFVQLRLIRAHDEQPRFTRLSHVARPVAQVKLSGFVRTAQQPSRDGHQDCHANDRDASGTNPMVPCQVPKDEHDQADADQRGGQEGTPHRLSVSAATVLTTSLLSVTPARDQPKSQCHWAQGWASYPNTGRNLKRAGEGVNDVLISGD